MRSPRYYLEKRAKQGFRGNPIATIAFYGPTAEFASKVAVAVFRTEGGKPDVLERLFSEGADVRFDEVVGEKVLSVIESHGVQSVVMTDNIIGCPHEEGVDYPEGTSCPAVPLLGRARSFYAGTHSLTASRAPRVKSELFSGALLLCCIQVCIWRP